MPACAAASALALAAAVSSIALCHAAPPTNVAVQQWSMQYSAQPPNGQGALRVVLYQQSGSPQIAIMQANDVHGGLICGIKTASGELEWCSPDGTASGSGNPGRGPLAVDDGSQGLMAYMQIPGQGAKLVVRQAYGASLQWNNSNQFVTNTNGFPIPAFGGEFVFAGTEDFHVFGAMFGQKLGAYGADQGLFGGSIKTLNVPTSSGTPRKLALAPWFCDLVMYDFTNLTLNGDGSMHKIWSFTRTDGSLPSRNSCPASSVVSADKSTLIVWSDQSYRWSEQYFIALDVHTGKQVLPFVLLPVWSSVIAAPSGYIVTYYGNCGPAVFYHMTPPALAWNASTYPATDGLGLFQCDANDGNHGPAIVVCTAIPLASSSVGSGNNAGTRLLAWDVASGKLLVSHTLEWSVTVVAPPKLDENGVSVYLVTAVRGVQQATNLTKFVITPAAGTTTAAPEPTTGAPTPPPSTQPPAGGIIVDEYPGLNCAGTPTRVTYAVGCTASSASTSALRYCAGGAMRVQWFSSSSTCDGTPTTEQSAKVGVCESSPLSGTSFEVAQCA